MIKVFLSHSSRDKDLARQIANDLKKNNIDVWFDEWEISVGESISQKISHGLENSNFVAVLLTKNSVNSTWVEKEWQSKIGQEAFKKEVAILPLKADDCSIPQLLKDKKYADVSTNYHKGFEIFVNSLMKLTESNLSKTNRKVSQTEEHNTNLAKLRSLETQLQAFRSLTGGIAHDVDKIFEAIMGYNQIIISGRTVNETEISYLKNIGELIQRSRELIRQLPLFYKKVVPLSKVVNINQEISSLRNLLAKCVPKMIDIQTNLNENIFPLMADPHQIGQIIMNLVINARDAMSDRGKILITTNNMLLCENTSIAGLNIPAGNYIELTVSDTGCGMDKELIQHIFEPFFTTKEVGKGTGLGLAVVHSIVKNHDGFIYCKSEPNKGATFKIIFPALTSSEPLQKIEE